MASRFSMTKLYFDCVSEEGDAAIVYCADVSWRGVRLSVGSVLESGKGQAPSTRTALGQYKVSDATGAWALEHARLGVRGRWRSLSPTFAQTLYEEAGGFVRWECLAPAAQVELEIGGRVLRGTGYAECLNLTIPPWRLPMRQLRWGRFVSARHSLAWIDWEGPHSVRLALLDGCRRDLVSVTESAVTAEGAELRMDAGVILRDGRLGDTVLPGLPALARLFPSSLFSVRETKWLSRARMEAADGESDGWAIHELVQWAR